VRSLPEGRDPLNALNALTALRRAVAARSEAQRGEAKALVRAREAGATFAEIGEAAGITRQAAWKALRVTRFPVSDPNEGLEDELNGEIIATLDRNTGRWVQP
jgi:hypothetical protein